MVETGAIHRRRPAVILGRAEHNDGIGAMEFLQMRIVNDTVTEEQKKCGGCGEWDDCPKQPYPMRPGSAHITNVGSRGTGRLTHPCAKNSEMSCDEIAPSRRIFQRASSSVRSTMVEAISRGEVPPSTMMGMRIPSWSRTASAVVHSDSPLKFAEVAVIGMPAAFTTSKGIFAFGTRKATLPVLAVTFSGRREAALTMIVMGPGQNFFASARNSSGKELAKSSACSTSSINKESGLWRDRDLIS